MAVKTPLIKSGIKSSPRSSLINYSSLIGDDNSECVAVPHVVNSEGDGDESGSRSLTNSLTINGQVSPNVKLDSGFETVGLTLSRSSLDPSTATALFYCKKYILFSYNVLLVVIGWRGLRSKYDNISFCKKLFNYFYPLVIFTMLLFACSCQTITCFSRSRSHAPVNVPVEGVSGHTRVISCDSHLITSDIMSYFMILSSFIIGWYVFRYAEPENVSSLAETVFLSYNKTSPRKSRTRPVIVLLFFIILGIIWFIGSFLISLVRLWGLHLYSPYTIIQWFTRNFTDGRANHNVSLVFEHHTDYQFFHYFFTFSAFVGFTFFDLLYIAVVLNYCFQCQLLTFYIRNIIDKVHSKAFATLSEPCKEVYRLYEFLKQLNRWLSWITTLIMFTFLGNLIASYRDLNNTHHHLNIVLGFLNIAQWMTAVMFPIIMATRFMVASKSLVRLGLSIAQRPYSYSQSSDMELQYFLTFMNSTNFSAKLAFVPMYPALVCGCIFVGALLLSVGILMPRLESVSWF